MDSHSEHSSKVIWPAEMSDCFFEQPEISPDSILRLQVAHNQDDVDKLLENQQFLLNFDGPSSIAEAAMISTADEIMQCNVPVCRETVHVDLEGASKEENTSLRRSSVPEVNQFVQECLPDPCLSRSLDQSSPTEEDDNTSTYDLPDFIYILPESPKQMLVELNARLICENFESDLEENEMLANLFYLYSNSAEPAIILTDALKEISVVLYKSVCLANEVRLLPLSSFQKLLFLSMDICKTYFPNVDERNVTVSLQRWLHNGVKLTKFLSTCAAWWLLSSSGYSHVCFSCGVFLQRPEYLESHITRDHGDLENCPFLNCTFGFSAMTRLFNHLVEFHNVSRPYLLCCRISNCGKSFSSFSELICHQKERH